MTDLLKIYAEATKLAWENNQVVGEDHYITLNQLEELFKIKFKDLSKEVV